MSNPSSIKNFLSLVKFSHTIFALPFAMVGFFLAIQYAHYPFDIKVLLFVVLCMVFARNSAMSFNRYIDRDIDKANPRTATVREIPSGAIQPNSALLFVIINSLAFIVTTYFINPLCFYLSPVALIVVLGYSYTKRFTALCHLVLGVGLSLAPIGAFLAVTGYFDWLPLVISFAVLFWVSGFDIIYSLQDEDFDKSQQLHSIPTFLGAKKALYFSNFLHIITGSLLISAGYLGDFGFIYWIGAVIFISLLIYQHYLVSPTDLSKVNMAFFTTNGIASVIFGSLVIADLYLM